MNSTQQPGAGFHLPSLFLVLSAGLGILAGLLGVALFGVLGLSALFSSGLSQAVSNLTLAWSAGMVVLLSLPALFYSLPRLAGRPAPRWNVQAGWKLSSLAMLLWVLDLAAASLLASRLTAVSAFLLPPLAILAAAMPVWFLIEFGRRGLRASPQRTWGVVSATLTVTLPVIILVELGGMVAIGMVAVVWLMGVSPELVSRLEHWLLALRSDGISAQALISELEPYLQQPVVAAAGLAIFGLIMPLVEELLKTLALWFVPRQAMSEAEGFTLGLVAGGTFALVETLNTLPAMVGPDWVFLALARAGTGLLHITCGGLVGWGLVSAWQKANYLRLGLLFLGSVGIHGAWNTFVQFTSLQSTSSPLALKNSILPQAAPVVLAALPVLMAVGLAALNRRLQNQQARDDALLAAQAASLASAAPLSDSLAIPGALNPAPLAPTGSVPESPADPA